MKRSSYTTPGVAIVDNYDGRPRVDDDGKDKLFERLRRHHRLEEVGTPADATRSADADED